MYVRIYNQCVNLIGLLIVFLGSGLLPTAGVDSAVQEVKHVRTHNRNPPQRGHAAQVSRRNDAASGWVTFLFYW